VHSCGALSFDTVTRMFSYAGNALALTPREHAVLETLITAQAAPSPRKSCSTKCSRWATTPTSTPSTCTSTACAKARHRRPDAAVITTLRGIGYLLQPPRAAAATRPDAPWPARPASPPGLGAAPGSLRGQLLRWLLGPCWCWWR
jgi:two-component system response regulator TctD